MQALRDDMTCADEEQAARVDSEDPGLSVVTTFDIDADATAPVRARGGARPRVAILREQGVNGQIEMAAAFDRAGFEAVDVHMTDILGGRIDLAGFRGLAACGGFSYGDVLGAGEGWAKSILFNGRARDMFAAFFERSDTFTLGVCNGCQMVAALKEIIPGAKSWPRFVRNRSDGFEARLALVKIDRRPVGAAARDGRFAHSDRGRARRRPRRMADRRRPRRPRAGRAGRRHASSITAAARPSSIRTTRTARPAASPR